jgi:broad specificity phosphatase PhoE
MCNIVTIATFQHLETPDNRDNLRARDQDLLPEQVAAWRTYARPVKRILRSLALGFEAIYCPTTSRHLWTAIHFTQVLDLPPPIPDSRINNVDYGIYKGRPTVETPRACEHIETPYEGGTSWMQVATEWQSFMEDVVPRYRGRAILLAGQSGAGPKMLAHFCDGTPLHEVLAHKQRKRVWQYRW